ncbi:MAG: deoxyribodipyrimidine photo-lyase [Acidimicrobiia bacterium]|nr:deoxyribodipyrimidine photo-lyase [Acidimicrobiia bacterium]
MPDARARPGIVWFRRDLRLDDNPAWAAATGSHDEVVAVFVLEPTLLQASGQMRRDQLFAHLRSLHERLVERGGGLVVRPGPADSAIPSVLADSDAWPCT